MVFDDDTDPHHDGGLTNGRCEATPADDAAVPVDLPSHTDTIKFADKIEPFNPTSNRVETQLKFRRYVHTIALRSQKTRAIRGCGRAGFALSTFEGGDMKEMRAHLATVLLISTREAASDLLKSIDGQQDGRALFLVP